MSTNNGPIPLPPHPDDEQDSEEVPQEDLERVREIILGAEQKRNGLKAAETDRLRTILFGAQIEDYERRIGDLRRDLDRLGGDMRQAQERIAELEKGASRRFDAVELDLRRLADDFRREQDRQRGRDTLFQQLAAQVRQHEATLAGTSDRVADLEKTQARHDGDLRAGKADQVDARDQLEQRAQALRREIRQSEDSLRAELRRLTDRLERQKTDRRALASMLTELATRLETGNTVTGLLEGFSDTKD